MVAVLLKQDFPGLSTQYIHGKASLMASATGMVSSWVTVCSYECKQLTTVVLQIFMEDVEVPKENMLPKVKGLKVRFHQ